MESTDPTSETESTVRRNASTGLAIRWVHPGPDQQLVELRHAARLGRDARCEIQLDARSVSREHAEVLREGPVFSLRDNASSNGTFVGGVRIEHSVLTEGAVVRIGPFVGIVELVSGGETGGPSPELAPGLFGGLAMRRALGDLPRVAPSDLPIILQGETGTGKEVVARAIHLWSGRSGPFCAINAAALPAELAEAELFGCRRGAFSGADRDRLGHFRNADRGTLLLDEIGDLELRTQGKLLRALQEGEVVPLGESRPVKVDVRIVVACQSSLADTVRAGQFRGDLYMRLKGLEVSLPPLRNRVADIPALFSSFLQDFSGGHARPVDARVVERLCLHDWPGNVRELLMLAKRIAASHPDRAAVTRRLLPRELRGSSPSGNNERKTRYRTRRKQDFAQLSQLLKINGGNLSRACAEMNISRQRAYRLLDGVSVADLITATAHHGASRDE